MIDLNLSQQTIILNNEKLSQPAIIEGKSGIFFGELPGGRSHTFKTQDMGVKNLSKSLETPNWAL